MEDIVLATHGLSRAYGKSLALDKAGPEREYINTVWGIGYKMAEP